ncbi:MAG: hypothetical protein VB075_05910 [Petrimonas sp.]|uniref:hypothetical protein n=1 Tax=Petrimonas sp. TaxID=2023866 RepID=UPI002B3DC4AA|nr:hypothetical protein [Petrimonas sp.]MEA4980311.1 hypothetical protein [Petrimonas sp.]MEA5044100.1 hypothetical protein [Petrimonas sp.]
MARSVTLYSLQWGDLSLEGACVKAKESGYDSLEPGLPDHLDVRQTDPVLLSGPALHRVGRQRISVRC